MVWCIKHLEGPFKADFYILVNSDKTFPQILFSHRPIRGAFQRGNIVFCFSFSVRLYIYKYFQAEWHFQTFNRSLFKFTKVLARCMLYRGLVKMVNQVHLKCSQKIQGVKIQLWVIWCFDGQNAPGYDKQWCISSIRVLHILSQQLPPLCWM